MAAISLMWTKKVQHAITFGCHPREASAAQVMSIATKRISCRRSQLRTNYLGLEMSGWHLQAVNWAWTIWSLGWEEKPTVNQFTGCKNFEAKLLFMPKIRKLLHTMHSMLQYYIQSFGQHSRTSSSLGKVVKTSLLSGAKCNTCVVNLAHKV